jgi:hypothetical protein
MLVMSNFKMMSSVVVQFSPAEAPVQWYIAFFLLFLLVLAAWIGFYMARKESKKQPPINHETLINAFEEPLVILDHEDTLLSANFPFRSLFGSDIEGKQIGEVLEDHPAVRTAIIDRTETVVAVETEENDRQFELHIYSAGTQPRPPHKWVIQFHEVTDSSVQE